MSRKEIKMLLRVAGGLTIFTVVCIAISTQLTTEKREEACAKGDNMACEHIAAIKRKAVAEQAAKAWSTRLIRCEALLKRSLKDPDSYRRLGGWPRERSGDRALQGRWPAVTEPLAAGDQRRPSLPGPATRGDRAFCGW